MDGPTAVVLGAREGTPNIGSAIVDRLALDDWEAIGDDCMIQGPERPPGALQQGGESYERYDAPSFDQFCRWDADALVITLGATHMEPFTEVSAGAVAKVLQGSLLLPLEAARRYVQASEKARGLRFRSDRLRRILFIGSYAHRHPFTNGTAYCVAKAGIDMAAKTMGWELTDRGYRVHVVHPFHVKGTPMWEKVEQGVMETKGMTYEEADAYNRKDLKMPDLCTPEEVAGIVAWLLTDPAAEWTSGTAIELFGGAR